MATDNKRVGKIRPGDMVPGQPRKVVRTSFEDGGGVTLTYDDGRTDTFTSADDAIEVIVPDGAAQA